MRGQVLAGLDDERRSVFPAPASELPREEAVGLQIEQHGARTQAAEQFVQPTISVVARAAAAAFEPVQSALPHGLRLGGFRGAGEGRVRDDLHMPSHLAEAAIDAAVDLQPTCLRDRDEVGTRGIFARFHAWFSARWPRRDRSRYQSKSTARAARARRRAGAAQ